MQITTAELNVMKVLWETPGLGASEVHAAIETETGWSSRTVKTLLSRLVEKGALSTEAEGRRFLYTPAIKKDTYEAKAARRFVDRVFGGRAAPLVAHLADGEGLTSEDIEELEKLLGELKK